MHFDAKDGKVNNTFNNKTKFSYATQLHLFSKRLFRMKRNLHADLSSSQRFYISYNTIQEGKDVQNERYGK